jgi:hypothetical protein
MPWVTSSEVTLIHAFLMYSIFIFCPNTKTAGRFQGGICAKNVQKTSKFQNKTGANFSAHLPTGVRFSKILTWLSSTRKASS